MLFGNRRPRKLTARRHDVPVFQPRGERLEAKIFSWPSTWGERRRRICRSSPRRRSASMMVPTSASAQGPATASPTSATYRHGLRRPGDRRTQRDRQPADDRRGSGTGFVYLVFGSAYRAPTSATDGIQNWLNTTGAPNLAANDRVGDLSPARNATQTNPITGTSALNFPFTGVTFTGVALARCVGRGGDAVKRRQRAS